jgi:integrase
MDARRWSMPKAPEISYWERKGGGYFCNYKRKKRELALGPDDRPTGPTYLAALDAFKALLEEKPRPAQKAGGATIREVLETYLKRIAQTKKSGTVQIRQRSFMPFVNHKTRHGLLGEKLVSDLTHLDVYAFLDHMEKPRHQKRKKEQPGREAVGWTGGSKRNCVVGLIAAFNWAKKGKLITENPLDGIDKESSISRGSEALIGNSTEEIEANHKRILEASPAPYHAFLQALKDTGARPGELMAATAADFKPEMGAFVFQKEATRKRDSFSHKTARKKDRVIFLKGKTLETVKELVTLYPTGPLFRRVWPEGSRHRRKATGAAPPFTRVSIVDRFLKLQKRLGMPNLSAVSYRHQFATSMILAGCDIQTLASLMGNSTRILEIHYSHLLSDTKALREKLERFGGA